MISETETDACLSKAWLHVHFYIRSDSTI